MWTWGGRCENWEEGVMEETLKEESWQDFMMDRGKWWRREWEKSEACQVQALGEGEEDDAITEKRDWKSH